MSSPNDEITPIQLSEAAKKFNVAKEKKEVGDVAFKAGELKDALRAYHECIMFLKGIDKNAFKAISGDAAAATGAAADGPPKPKTENKVDALLEKVYANQSACHLKNSNWQRAVETADQSLKINGENFKSMFRKGKALGEQGFFDRALKVLEDLKTKNPSDAPSVNAEIARLRAIDNEREKIHKAKMKGFLSRDFKSEKKPEKTETSPPAKPASAFIEEVVDEPAVVAAAA